MSLSIKHQKDQIFQKPDYSVVQSSELQIAIVSRN